MFKMSAVVYYQESSYVCTEYGESTVCYSKVIIIMSNNGEVIKTYS